MQRSRVGIRELRQNLSVYIRRVLDGDTFEVTEHGRPVALLGPLADASTPLARLVREGRVRKAPDGELLELGLPPGPVSNELSEALQEMREDRF